MMSTDLSLPQPGTVLTGPFWPGHVRVLHAYSNGPSVRIEAVGVGDGQYYDRTLTLDQFQTQVSELLGEGRRLFGLDIPGRLGNQARYVALEGQGLGTQVGVFSPYGSGIRVRLQEKGAGPMYSAAGAWRDLSLLSVRVA